MSMELLVTPYLAQPTGYYTADEARAVEVALHPVTPLAGALPPIPPVSGLEQR